MRWLFRAIVLLAWLFSPLPAAAQPDVGTPAAEESPQARAEVLKKEGDAAMEQLSFLEALDKYEQAYALNPQPALVYNRGRALQALGRFPLALEAFRKFRIEASDDLKARVPHLDELISEVRIKVSTLTVRTNVPGATILLDDKLIGTAPLEGEQINAGSALLVVEAKGHDAVRRQVTLPGGSVLELNLQLQLSAQVGALVVRSSVAGAVVAIDGVHVGTVPAAQRLDAGPHRVVVSHPDYLEAEVNALVVAGGRQFVDVPLEPAPSITGQWWFWGGLGVVVVAAAVITAAALTERDTVDGNIAPGTISAPIVSF